MSRHRATFCPGCFETLDESDCKSQPGSAPKPGDITMKPTRAEIIRVLREWIILLEEIAEPAEPHIRREIECIKEAIRIIQTSRPSRSSVKNS